MLVLQYVMLKGSDTNEMYECRECDETDVKAVIKRVMNGRQQAGEIADRERTKSTPKG